MLKVAKIFYSIQGEASYCGYPCVFVRLSGCNLQCTYCDTKYARTGGTWLSLGTIVKRVLLYKCGLVELTGGEPLLQKETPILASKLIDAGLTVLVETNGSYDISVLPRRAIKIVDLKCPSSGMVSKNCFKNLSMLEPNDQVKMEISCWEDFDWAIEQVKKKNITKNDVFFSPNVFGVEPRTLAQWLLEKAMPVRLQIQLHKIIGIE